MCFGRRDYWCGAGLRAALCHRELSPAHLSSDCVPHPHPLVTPQLPVLFLFQKLHLSEDVAGATFMAAGSSTPELFASVIGKDTGQPGHRAERVRASCPLQWGPFPDPSLRFPTCNPKKSEGQYVEWWFL